MSDQATPDADMLCRDCGHDYNHHLEIPSGEVRAAVPCRWIRAPGWRTAVGDRIVRGDDGVARRLCGCVKFAWTVTFAVGEVAPWKLALEAVVAAQEPVASLCGIDHRKLDAAFALARAALEWSAGRDRALAADAEWTGCRVCGRQHNADAPAVCGPTSAAQFAAARAPLVDQPETNDASNGDEILKRNW